MARLRKAAKIWRRPEARTAAVSVLVAESADFFTVNPEAIFNSSAPLEVELGAGKGDFIVARAVENPDRNFLAIELSGLVSRMLAVRCGRAGLSNLRVIRMDARSLVNLMLESESVSTYHIYFPDPWPKERHHKHRLFTPHFVAGLYRTMAVGGTLQVATDVPDYARQIFQLLDESDLVLHSAEVPAPSQTAFGKRFIATGKPIYARTYRKRGAAVSGSAAIEPK